MKKYLILLVVMLFSVTSVFADPPGLPSACPCCEEMIDEETGLPFPDLEDDYSDCDTACTAGENPCVPIDSYVLILFAVGASFGIFKVYQNKKRQFEK